MSEPIMAPTNALEKPSSETFTEEEKAKIGHYIALVPQYVSSLWSYLMYIGSARIEGNFEDLANALVVAENVWSFLPPEFRTLVDNPREVVRARVKDIRNYGFKALGFGFTEWQLDHSTNSQRGKNQYKEQRFCIILSAYLLEFQIKVTNLFSEANILLPQDSRSSLTDFPELSEFIDQSKKEAAAAE